MKISCLGKYHLIRSKSRERSVHYGIHNITWYHAGKRISNNRRYSIDNNGALTIYEVNIDDSGTFICQISSKFGKYKFEHDILGE